MTHFATIILVQRWFDRFVKFGALNLRQQNSETHKNGAWRFLVVYAFYASTEATLCPVLRSQSEEGLLYGYPAEVLLPSVLADHPHAKFRNCTERNLQWANDVPKLCSQYTSLCAVTKQNVQTAMGVADWPQYSEALYRLQTAIAEDKPHEMNIIVLGGSMTRGSVTFSACMCQKKVDSTCPELLEKSEETDCAWVTMLSRWIEKDFTSSKITIHVHNLARTGATSHFMADNVADQLRLIAHKTTLSASDLVIVDHSVNDTYAFLEELQLGFESLIRRLLHLTQGGERPTIIVLEQHPVASKRQVTRGLHGVGDYAVTYREISKHYGLLLWSLREVTWTYLNLTIAGALNNSAPVDRQVLVDGVQHVRMYPKPVDNEFHPPWWRHLFVADVLADCMLRVMALVSSDAPGLFLRADMVTAPYVIPAPIRNISALTQGLCDTSQPFLVDAHPVSFFTPADVGAFETDTATVSKLGWREYTDYHGTPGWIINSLSNRTHRHLTFLLANTNDFHHQAIKLVYLKSYVGMGAVGVKICGDYIYGPHLVDALYHDHETFRVSLPTVWTYVLGQSEHDRCMNATVSERTLQIEYVRFKDQFARVRRQNHRKFKLLSAQICTPVYYK